MSQSNIWEGTREQRKSRKKDTQRRKSSEKDPEYRRQLGPKEKEGHLNNWNRWMGEEGRVQLLRTIDVC